MAYTTERRPGRRGGAPNDAHGDGISGSLTGLRRRREAARRLPPLPDGHRDPLDQLAARPVRTRPHCCTGEFTADGEWAEHCRGAA